MNTATAAKTAAKKVKKSRGTATQKAASTKKPTTHDVYGFLKGSATSKAIALLATGKHTMAEAKAKYGSTFYNALNKVTTKGFKVKHNDDNTFAIVKKAK